MIQDEIRKANIQAMKEKDAIARGIYAILLNKILMESKKGGNVEVDDALVISILQKTLKELKEEADAFEKAGREATASDIKRQIEIVQSFLPKMMGEEEIKNIIDALQDKSVPSVMKHFKTNYAGKVDMGLVNAILRKGG